MLKTKTVNVVNKEGTNTRESLYKPKGFRWIRYIVRTAMIGFILLLILMNVNFVNKPKTEFSTAATIGTTKTVTTLMPQLSEQRVRSYNLQLNNAKTVLPVAFCSDKGGDKCTIFCLNGNLNYLASDLEHTGCSDDYDLSVIINNCSFPYQQLMTSNFRGYFNLKSLEIFNSDLVEIVDGAFDIDSMTTLMVLNMSTIGITKLTERSFKGLKVLQELKFLNVLSYQTFVGAKFLQPLAKTLQQLSFCQKSNRAIYDPFSWFDGDEKYLSVTRLNLSGNNFANKLTEKTFGNFPAVHELILADCALTELDINTFTVMMDTLEYLDLSSNALKMLNVSAFTSKNGLRLELHGNEWNCTCGNYELLKALQASQFTYDEEPLCLTPSQWKDKPLKEVTLKCEEEPTTTQEPPSYVTTSPGVSESTTSTTKTNTTNSPVEASTPSMETSPNITKTTLTTTSPVETPSNTTKSTVTTSTFETTNASLEISASSITSSESEETEGSEDGKIKNTTSSASITTTTSSPPKQSTPEPVNLIELPCKHMLDSVTPSNYTIYIRNFDIRFTVRPISSSSVVLLISSFEQHLKLIYFTANNRTYVSTTVKSGPRSIRSSASYTMIHVENLNSNETYIFCLKSTEEHTMSSFNCQSHHIENITLQEYTAWLLTNDQAWFCIVITFIIMLTLCLGIITVYWLLRWRPTWLRGCKRIIRTDAITHEVYLLPKPPQKSSETDDSTFYNERNFNDIRANFSLNFDSCDYMQFYKDMQNSNRNRKIQTLSSILSPKEPAPAVPQNQSRTITLHSTTPADDLIEHCEAVDDNDYQSIDYYEQLF